MVYLILHISCTATILNYPTINCKNAGINYLNFKEPTAHQAELSGVCEIKRKGLNW